MKRLEREKREKSRVFSFIFSFEKEKEKLFSSHLYLLLFLCHARTSCV